MKRNSTWFFPLTALLVSLGIPAAAGAAGLDPSRVQWKHLHFAAQESMGSMQADLSLAEVSARALREQLVPSPRGHALEPTGRVLHLQAKGILEAPLLGRTVSENGVWFLPRDGTALQRVKLRTGRKAYRKTYRFTREGAFRLKIAPKGKSRAKLPEDQWTRKKESFYTYSPKQSGCSVVSEPTVLFYLVSATKPGSEPDNARRCYFYDDSLHHLALTVEGERKIEVDYLERGPKGSRRHRGEIDAVVVSIQAADAGRGGNDKEFDFLGMRGKIDLYLDKRTHIPVQVSGVVPLLGRIAIRLTEAQFQSATPP